MTVYATPRFGNLKFWAPHRDITEDLLSAWVFHVVLHGSSACMTLAIQRNMPATLYVSASLVHMMPNAFNQRWRTHLTQRTLPSFFECIPKRRNTTTAERSSVISKDSLHRRQISLLALHTRAVTVIWNHAGTSNQTCGKCANVGEASQQAFFDCCQIQLNAISVRILYWLIVRTRNYLWSARM